MNNKVVLAFSGGLDTSFCVPYLKNEKGLEVHTIMVNTGGFSKEEEKKIEEARTFLTYAVGKVLKTGCSLLGIEMPSKM